MSLNNKGRNLAFEGMMDEMNEALQSTKTQEKKSLEEYEAVATKPSKPVKVMTSFKLDKDIYEYLRYEGRRRGRNTTWMLEYIVRYFLERSPEPYITEEKVRAHLSE